MSEEPSKAFTEAAEKTAIENCSQIPVGGCAPGSEGRNGPAVQYLYALRAAEKAATTAPNPQF